MNSFRLRLEQSALLAKIDHAIRDAMAFNAGIPPEGAEHVTFRHASGAFKVENCYLRLCWFREQIEKCSGFRVQQPKRAYRRPPLPSGPRVPDDFDQQPLERAA